MRGRPPPRGLPKQDEDTTAVGLTGSLGPWRRVNAYLPGSARCAAPAGRTPWRASAALCPRWRRAPAEGAREAEVTTVNPEAKVKFTNQCAGANPGSGREAKPLARGRATSTLKSFQNQWVLQLAFHTMHQFEGGDRPHPCMDRSIVCLRMRHRRYWPRGRETPAPAPRTTPRL